MTRCRIAALQVLYWLSGLTCTDENFIIKAGAQRAAAAHGIALVAPDTSPRMLILNPCSHRVPFLRFMPVLLRLSISFFFLCAKFWGLTDPVS